MASVDIIIPNYNYARFLPACGESVPSQDVRPLRILIIDDASTDDSVGVAEALAARAPRDRARLPREDPGAAASFNEGIDLARRGCVDDPLLRRPVERRRAPPVGALEANPTAVLAFDPQIPQEYRAERWPVAAATWQLVDNPAFLRPEFSHAGARPRLWLLLLGQPSSSAPPSAAT